MATYDYTHQFMKYIHICFCILILMSCTQNENKTRNEHIREIVATEHTFMSSAKENGLTSAFFEFADENAVLIRGNKLIKGKDAIKEYFSSTSTKEVHLLWEPTFVDVAESGDLAYTYGPYTYEEIDGKGNLKESNGYFHTVWKQQFNGEWKYVWD